MREKNEIIRSRLMSLDHKLDNDALWEKLVPNLPEQKRRRKPFLPFCLGAALGLVITLSFLVLNKGTEKNITVNQPTIAAVVEKNVVTEVNNTVRKEKVKAQQFSKFISKTNKLNKTFTYSTQEDSVTNNDITTKENKKAPAIAPNDPFESDTQNKSVKRLNTLPTVLFSEDTTAIISSVETLDKENQSLVDFFYDKTPSFTIDYASVLDHKKTSLSNSSVVFSVLLGYGIDHFSKLKIEEKLINYNGEVSEIYSNMGNMSLDVNARKLLGNNFNLSVGTTLFKFTNLLQVSNLNILETSQMDRSRILTKISYLEKTSNQFIWDAYMGISYGLRVSKFTIVPELGVVYKLMDSDSDNPKNQFSVLPPLPKIGSSTNWGYYTRLELGYELHQNIEVRIGTKFTRGYSIKNDLGENIKTRNLGLQLGVQYGF